MNHYCIVIYNKANPNEKERIDVHANSIEEAENNWETGLVSRETGWGVYDSYEVDDIIHNFSKEQGKGIRKRVDELLGFVITDSQDRGDVVNSILEDVCEDISETAEWETLFHDEYCEGDIDIAVARVLHERLAR